MADARDGNGRFTRNLTTAQRDAQAAELRAAGHTYAQIAEQLGYSDKSAAHKAVEKILRETVSEPAEAVRKLELERLDTLWRAVMAVLKRKHLTVSHGKVIHHEDEPLEDDAPVLQAVDRALRIQERRAKLQGLDSPARVSVDAENLGNEIGALINALARAGEDDDPDDGA